MVVYAPLKTLKTTTFGKLGSRDASVKAYRTHACGGQIPCELMGRVAVAEKSWATESGISKSVLSLDRSQQVPGPIDVIVKRDPLSVKSSPECGQD
jgi:hypothetical protein